uniref:Homeobox-leucine zipper protein HAT9-like n=2 Tax=Nicotiana sylvestris TaxID=4096 RepID=A0A1U7VN60_NICSY|nr:PREDICTED: homeobox-leucine zipper protein HAT9-like [Nicotiana sylvestris]
MGNDNETCDTRLTLGLVTSDLLPKQNQLEEHKKIICLDPSIPLHSSDMEEKKTEGSTSKNCKNDLRQAPNSTSPRNFNNFDNESKKNGMRKKLRLTKEQSTLLEESFKRHTTLAMGQKQELAAKLKLKPRQVEVWFQNRRARTKLKQTEVDCEFLKKCCQNLNDENSRLKKELQELRSIKIDQWASPFHLRLPKIRTIALCPSCQKTENIKSEQKHCDLDCGNQKVASDAMSKEANSDTILVKEKNK